ncbi:MAG: acetyltransferase [Pseudomonadales bacterium]|nr:acetyltransferase [Pseudomonadales bacterium]
MFLKETLSDHLVEVLDITELLNPLRDQVTGRFHFGEEAQEPETFAKKHLIFPSGEPLPACWTDPHFRDSELRVTGSGL